MPLGTQAKLLRVLENGELTRVGALKPRVVDVRFVASTNRSLPALVAVGAFRRDLYFRLNGITITVPPLRERPADILPLAEFFARRYATLNGLPERGLSEVARQRLLANSWRGNVRELENTLHRAVLLARGNTIDADAIEIGPESAQAAPTAIAGFVGRRMDEVERDVILQTLRHTEGNRTHAATILGISIRALRNKLRDYAAEGAAVPPPSAGVAA